MLYLHSRREFPIRFYANPPGAARKYATTDVGGDGTRLRSGRSSGTHRSSRLSYGASSPRKSRRKQKCLSPFSLSFSLCLAHRVRTRFSSPTFVRASRVSVCECPMAEWTRRCTHCPIREIMTSDVDTYTHIDSRRVEVLLFLRLYEPYRRLLRLFRSNDRYAGSDGDLSSSPKSRFYFRRNRPRPACLPPSFFLRSLSFFCGYAHTGVSGNLSH